MQIDPTERFTQRAEHYARYRPHYPEEIVPFLADAIGLTPRSVIADIGSGTGLLSELWLANGNSVYGVEPNADMRQMGERLLAGEAGFHSVAATAEATSLAEGSVDIVTAGSAFHWFDPVPTRAEFARILKPGGWVVLAWNSRQPESGAFAAGFNELLQEYRPDRQPGDRRSRREEHIAEFFGPNRHELAVFPNHQVLDLEGVRGRLLSLSATPLPGEMRHEAMMAALSRLFEQYQQDGAVRFDYRTQVFYGRLD